MSDVVTSLAFYDPADGGLQSAFCQATEAGAKRLAIVSGSGDAEIACQVPDVEGVSVDRLNGADPAAVSAATADHDAVVLCEALDLDALSKQLLACLDMQGMVLAPLTEDHISRRGVYLISIPKSGTHMAIRLLEAFGLKRITSSLVPDGRWGTLEDGYHTSCREYMLREWSADPLGSHPLFRSPAIFIYRNPLDILASELAWYQRGENAFSHCLRTDDSLDDRLMRLINDPMVFGTIRDRMNRYVGWMRFSNVIPVSYEELVGSTADGSDAERLRTVWSLQLKLQAPGTPSEMAAQIYDPASPTFNKGRIGSYKEVFREVHYEMLKSLDQDFMEQMGFDATGEQTVGRRVEEFRRRPLGFWRPRGQEAWAPKLIKESFFGHNIVAANGQYYAISQALGPLDLDNPEDRARFGIGQGWATIDEAVQSVTQSQVLPMQTQLSQLLQFSGAVRANRMFRFGVTLARFLGNKRHGKKRRKDQ